MSTFISVLVSRLGDKDVFEFKVEPRSIVRALKLHIADVHRIAPGCQVLVYGDTVVGDNERVGDVLEAGCDTLCLSLVLCSEELEKTYDRLLIYSDKFKALETIGLWFSQGTGDERAIRAVTSQFEEFGPPVKKPGPSDVQLLAIQTLEEITTKGDDLAMAEVIKRINGDARVQHVAFLALPTIAEKGDEHALAVLYGYLDNDHESTRQLAVNCIVEVAGQGNTRAIAEVIRRLSYPEPGVRESAALCLGRIAEKGDAHVIQALRESREDPVGCVQRAATKALEVLTAD